MHFFVEGRQLDCYVYGKLARAVCGDIPYRISRADQIPGAGGGGKSVLLRLYDSLRRAGTLVDNFKGHAQAVIFLVDKDIDDLSRRQKRSPHVIYTPTYDLEAVVFHHGDLIDAVAATCSLDESIVTSSVGHGATWLARAMSWWTAWLQLCCVAHLNNIRSGANFGAPSAVNPLYSSSADAALVASYGATLRAACASGPMVFDRSLALATRRIQTNGAERYFKGKWFAAILEDQMLRLFPAETKRVSNFRSEVVKHLAQSLSVADPWVDHYRIPITGVLATLSHPPP